ncbi:uncharacterized protein CCOS01_13540 [Colletotrichum costaricense]|uniref:2-oxoadipate dioxygenase/decarboxylase n=1 Tax=Colletotrichum costaricense TaxID=1209916 RepID=A0AAJ0DVV3_9PEZI|nr:uncharacterized protein CCOS01_13540 [Colletotrichum costaricense]KAK1515347.1 hypothetical protein CCOS01_13540 [Colletotrichum costaricense]
MRSTTEHVDADEIRSMFAASLSDLYRDEVQQYGTLLDLVSHINHKKSVGEYQPGRIDVERHGAIRLGTAEELAQMRRMFSIMGMYPVGYYDLTIAGLPVHATAFRPVTSEHLERNPFRVFTSLLQLELICDQTLRSQAAAILAKRSIFTPDCLELIDELEGLVSIPRAKAARFITEAIETFRWHKTSTVDLETYRALQDAHPLIADIVCFRGPHINHLTPRVLDIDEAQSEMLRRGLEAKEVIEGPPRRECPILLRQTSFLALEERIAFANGEQDGKHKARFGEIEQRGVALTPAGRQLYDRLIQESFSYEEAGRTKEDHLTQCFKAFPDDWIQLRQQGLAYFSYALADENALLESRKHDGVTSMDDAEFDALIDSGLIKLQPITYEDFLPISAAGIFHSNLRSGGVESAKSTGNRQGFEDALQAKLADSNELYERMEKVSREACIAML